MTQEKKDYGASLAAGENDTGLSTTEAASGGCGYQGYEYGAGSYPDSICVDGLLFDADACDNDGNLYVPDEEMPCPICDKKAAIGFWRERGNKNAKQLVEDIRRNRGMES